MGADNAAFGRRAAVVVLDACGVGALPDADLYGDAGTNTLGHLAEAVGGLCLPTLERLGLGSIIPLVGVPPADDPVLHGRLHPLGPGKDTTAGHWELMGVVAPAPAPTYPEGFPAEVVERLRTAWGRDIICNRPYSGIEVLDDYGAEQLRTGELIVYTSQDSVLQVAGHVDVVPTDELYGHCAAARRVMAGEHAVGRVIARPFRGAPGAFERTEGRRDFALAPSGPSYMEAIEEAGLPVHAVGKVAQVFAQRGVTQEHSGPTNARAIAATTSLLRDLDAGLIFTNLVETDQVYGHRNDVEGFHGALREIDAAVSEWLGLMRDGDMLVLTADHGCDPTTPGTDHTREHAPLLAVFAGHGGRRHDGPLADVGASVLQWLAGREAPLPGKSFVS